LSGKHVDATVKYLHLTLREPPEWRNPMHTFLMDHEEMHRADLLNWNTRDDDLDVILFRITGTRDPYTAALAEAPFIVDYETARIDDDSFYVYIEHETREVDCQFREPFLEKRVLVIPPIEYDEDGTTSVELVGRSEDVQELVDSIPEKIDVRIDQVGEYDRGLDHTSSLLTDRQQEAVQAAAEVGYYDLPREGTVEDVAAKLDCAPSTASTHLRKAQSRLVHRIL
jgi:predicted DNA binding protein